DQRKDIDRQQERDRWRNEQPRHRPVRQAARALRGASPAANLARLTHAGNPGLIGMRDRGHFVHRLAGSTSPGTAPGKPIHLECVECERRIYWEATCLPCSLKTLVQSFTRRSSACCDVPLSATT